MTANVALAVAARNSSLVASFGQTPIRLPCGFGSVTAARILPGLADGEVRRRHLTSNHAAHGHLCRKTRSPLATLVHQGSDPTLPYQALGDPTERQAYLEGVKAPRCQKALFGPRAIAVRGFAVSDRVFQGLRGVRPGCAPWQVVNLLWVQIPSGNWVAPAGSWIFEDRQ
jgi:hypothetical protein